MDNNYQFAQDIKEFNGMYRMQVAESPTLDVGVPLLKRLRDFKSILGKELDEIDDIIDKAEAYSDGRPYAPPVTISATHKTEDVRPYMVTPLEILTALADLLGDIQVYCASEMAKFGLPLNEVLSIIMQSNFSKMGADGKPIYDEQGKLQKGPNYWKPEPKISVMLGSLMVEAAARVTRSAPREEEPKVFGAFDALPIKPEVG